MMKRKSNLFWVVGSTIFLLWAITYSLSMGIVEISYQETLDILKFWQPQEASLAADTINYLRMPRFVLALIIGWGLALTGTVMQAIMKNPLADPYLLGISSGAGLGAVIAIVLGLENVAGFDCVGIFAFLGAMGITVCILAISAWNGKSGALSVLLSGMALNAICAAIMSFIIAVYASAEGIQSITFWLMGILLNASWDRISFLFIIVAIISIFFFSRYRILNLMLLGDEVSVTLGQDLSQARRLYILLCAVIVGFVVYNAGMIGFIGLIIPHIVRLVVGNNHLYLLPLSSLCGAMFLAWSDVLSRVVIEGSEIPIGVIVSLLGSPIFVSLLMSKKYGYGK